MQAKLPDINAAIVTYRNQMLHAYKESNYNLVIICWSAINSLLPKDYKVEIDSKKYNNLVEENKVIICDSCKEENKYQDVKFLSLLLNQTRSMMLHKTHERIWICKCKHENIFNPNQVKILKYEQPTYFEVIPEVPKRTFGISDRVTFDVAFRKWFSLASDEIESKIGKYRTDYIAQLEADGNNTVLDEEHEE